MSLARDATSPLVGVRKSRLRGDLPRDTGEPLELLLEALVAVLEDRWLHARVVLERDHDGSRSPWQATAVVWDELATELHARVGTPCSGPRSAVRTLIRELGIHSLDESAPPGETVGPPLIPLALGAVAQKLAEFEEEREQKRAEARELAALKREAERAAQEQESKCPHP